MNSPVLWQLRAPHLFVGVLCCACVVFVLSRPLTATSPVAKSAPSPAPSVVSEGPGPGLRQKGGWPTCPTSAVGWPVVVQLCCIDDALAGWPAIVDLLGVIAVRVG